jgi:hypothetical protein
MPPGSEDVHSKTDARFLMRINKPLRTGMYQNEKMPLGLEKEMPSRVQLFLFASLPFIAIADSVPKFDVARECRSEGGSKAVLEKCIEDESAARDQLQPLWIQSSTADKATCVGETSIDGTPSYVELLTCLEMARDAKKTPK